MSSRPAAFLVAVAVLVVLVVIVVIVIGTTQQGSPAENAPPGAGSSGSPAASQTP